MRKRRLLIPLFVLVLALGLAACGSSESDEDKIVDVVETSTVTTDPADCTTLLTQAFVEQSESEQGKAAVKSCEEDASDTSNNPDSVTVTEVEIDGSSATANAAFVGGNFDGQTLVVGLVEEDGDWKLDQITGFAEFDQGALVKTFEEGFNEDESIDPDVASCLAEGLEEASQEEVEEMILSRSPEAFGELVESCE